MKKGIAFACLLLLAAVAWRADDFAQQLRHRLDHARTAAFHTMQQAANPLQVPVTTNAEGRVHTANIYDWRSGFFAGNLWYLYEHTRDTALLHAAQKWTAALEPLKDFRDHHDLGFMVYCSYGNGYRITRNPQYRDVIIQAARSLCTRFDKRTGAIKSWNSFKSWTSGATYHFPVIIDNMMNLELLFFAFRETGDPYFKDVAVTHARNTLKHHFRKDFSAYHFIAFDTLTGAVVARESAQGYAHESAWSRGQAWALYGFTTTYRETRDKQFLNQARSIARYLMQHPNLPADKIPYWDYHAGIKGYEPVTKKAAQFDGLQQPRDASAAAITASALLELHRYVPAKEGAAMVAFAKDILRSLSTEAYLAEPGKGAPFLLQHSVGSLPHGGEIDVPLIYADYYYIEAMLRALALEKKKSA